MQDRQEKKFNLFFNHTVGMSCNDLQFTRKYNLHINDIYYLNCLLMIDDDFTALQVSRTETEIKKQVWKLYIILRLLKLNLKLLNYVYYIKYMSSTAGSY